MADYKVYFDKDVEKDLEKIPKSISRLVLRKVLRLSANPRPGQSLKLEGTEGVYRLRVGDYRAIYQIDDVRRCVIVYHVRHRKDVYRSL